MATMEHEVYELGTLIWADFEFPDDEENTDHPAIVLEVQEDEIVVISGSSYNTPDHLFIRNDKFTSFELASYGLEYSHNYISHTTYFKLEEVKGIKKNMIKRKCGELDANLLNELLQRCAMQSWFSANSIGDCIIKKWTLVCWKDDTNPKTRPFLILDELNFAVVVGKMKDGRLKILSEIVEGEKPDNFISLKDDLPARDLDEIILHSKPSILPREKICFLLGKIIDEDITRLQQLPYFRMKSRKNKSKLDYSLLKIGDIVCNKPSLEIPKMIVGFNRGGSPITVNGINTMKKKPKYVSRQFKITGFTQKYNFLLDSKLQTTRKQDNLFKIQDCTLTPEEIEYLSQEPSIKLHTTELFNPHEQKFDIGDIVCSETKDWISIRVPWLIVGDDKYHYYAIAGKENQKTNKAAILGLELKGFRSKIYFELAKVIPLNKFKIKFKHDVIPAHLKQELLSSNIVKALNSL